MSSSAQTPSSGSRIATDSLREEVTILLPATRTERDWSGAMAPVVITASHSPLTGFQYRDPKGVLIPEDRLRQYADGVVNAVRYRLEQLAVQRASITEKFRRKREGSEANRVIQPGSGTYPRSALVHHPATELQPPPGAIRRSAEPTDLPVIEASALPEFEPALLEPIPLSALDSGDPYDEADPAPQPQPEPKQTPSQVFRIDSKEIASRLAKLREESSSIRRQSRPDGRTPRPG
ncbi:hypothetical protein LBMAG53_24420 [Planctomycetota bacterium]|nr:hypothetical protein LBMAG53_24420 [Planctomycetota bacterium]